MALLAKLKAALLAAALVSLATGLGSLPAMAEPVRVFAAASLKTALDKVGAAWSAQDPGKSIVASYAASSALAKQIEEGAPADVFISADLDWMDVLDQAGQLTEGSRRSLLGNTLVLVAPTGSAVTLALQPGADLAGALGGGRLAVGDTRAVPAGRYAKSALEGLGLWAGVADKLAQTENVRAALALVARGEAPLGVVYGSDAKSESKVTVVAVFPETSHKPIIYPAARIKASANLDAAAFLAFLESRQASAIFAAEGLVPLVK
jgi:molybdate transport system substrate-binding protein